MGARGSCCFDKSNASGGRDVKVTEANKGQPEEQPKEVAEQNSQPVEEVKPQFEEGGCFLIFDEGANQGTLKLYWSESKVDGALAVLKPGKAVPKHKYTTNHGKTDVLKQANLGVHKQRYFEGFGQFIKSGKAHESHLILYSAEVRVTFLLDDDRVAEVQADTPIKVDDVVAIAVAAKDTNTFSGVRSIPLDQFTTRAQQTGHGFVKL